MTVNLRGLEVFRAGLADAIDAGAFETAQSVKRIRDELCPVDTGDLLESGELVKVDEGRYVVREGRGLPDARAVHTEYGTSKMVAQPHMAPAVAQTDALKIMKKHLNALAGRSKA